MSRRGLAPAAAMVLTVTLCLGSLAITGCGDADEGDTEATSAQTLSDTARRTHPLAAADVALIERARDEVHAYCARVADRLRGGAGPTPGDFERVTAALDGLAALGGRDPDGQSPDGSTAHLALGDIAENLEGTNCDQRLVDHIDGALAGLPPD